MRDQGSRGFSLLSASVRLASSRKIGMTPAACTPGSRGLSLTLRRQSIPVAVTVKTLKLTSPFICCFPVYAR